ncbi:MAG: nucleotidyltransferase family protein [Candidatus Xenobia bacterium]
MSVLVDAVVLAAGASRRMGQPKAWLMLEGETFVDRIVRHLRQVGVRDVVVVRPLEGPAIRGGREVVNPRPESEQIESMQLGLRALRGDADAVLVWPVDHPLVGPETVAQLLAAFAGQPLVQPWCGRPGHPVLFAARLIPELLAAGAGGARPVVGRYREQRLLLPVSDAGVTANIDTPDAYHRIISG